MELLTGLHSNGQVTSHAHKYLTNRDKHFGLIRQGINYVYKKFYSTGPNNQQGVKRRAEDTQRIKRRVTKLVWQFWFSLKKYIQESKTKINSFGKDENY